MLTPALAMTLVLGELLVCADTLPEQPPAAPIRVECHGKMRTGVVAIGGETTGMTITFNGMTWELNCRDEAARTAAKQHHKQPMTVIGTLRQVHGKAIPVRWIVDVDRMDPRDAGKTPECANLTVQGMLQAVEGTAQTAQEMMINAAGIAWPLDLSAEMPLREKAAALMGKAVLLKGRLEQEPKVSPPRPILRVNVIEAMTTNTVSK